MRNVNKILVLFLFVMMISVFAIWEFVQSESFANVLSKSITEFTRIKLGADVNFEKLEFQVFPPGAVINDVDFVMPTKKQNITFKVKSLGVFFDLLDSFQTDLTIKKILMDDGEVIIQSTQQGEHKKAKDSSDNIALENIEFDKYIKQALEIVNNKLPVKVRNLELKDIAIDAMSNKLYTSQSKLSFNKKQLFLDLRLKEIELLRPYLNGIEFDSAKAELIISEQFIRLQEINIQRKLAKIKLSGLIKNIKKIKSLSYDLDSSLLMDIADIHDLYDLQNIAKLTQGTLDTECNIKGKYTDFKSICNINIDDFDTSFAYGDRISLKTTATPQNIVVNQFSLTHKKELLKLARPFEVYNFTTKNILKNGIELSAQSFDLNNALYYIKDKLDLLKGKLTGDILFSLGKNEFHFQTKNGTFIKDLKLVAKGSENSILELGKLTLDNGLFDIYGSDVKIDVQAHTERSDFSLKGDVAKGNVSLNIKKGKFNLDDFGKFAGFDVKGAGNIDVSVLGKEDVFKVDIKPNLQDFRFEGYKLNQISGAIQFDLGHSKIKFKKIRGYSGQTSMDINGVIDLQTLALDVEVNHKKLLYKDMLRIYNPLFATMDFLPKELTGNLKANMKVGGKATIKDLDLKGRLSGVSNYVYEESLDDFDIEFGLKNEVLNFDNIILRKGRGRILSTAQIDISTGKVNVTGNVQNIPLNEIQNYSKLPLDLSGNLDGYFNLIVDKKIKSFETQVYLNQARVSNKTLPNSFVDVSFQKEKLRVFANIFGETLELKSGMDLREPIISNQKLSSLSIRSKVKDLHILLGALRGVDVIEGNIKSDIKLSSDIKFNFNSIDKVDAKVNVERLFLSKGGVFVDYKGSSVPEVRVVDGEIKKWNANFRGKGFYLISKGRGNLLTQYDIGTKLKVDASVFEVFNKLISKSNGSFIIRIDKYKKNGVSDYDAVLTSNNMSLVTELLPATINKSNIRISYKNKKVVIDRFEAELSKGKLGLTGGVDFSNVIPQININYLIDEAGITLFEKSNLTLSGKGSLIGTNLPYTLNGEVNITKCNILNEITDFGGTEKITKQDLKYLPKNKTFIGNQALNFNLTINTREPVRLTNSRMDVGLEGNVQLIGGEKDPRMIGKVSLAPSNNRIYFQNNEYKLTKGNIYFYELEEITNPELDFLASTNIADHKILLKVYGPVSDYKVDLSSEPSLEQENILSLIAFGYSEDLTSSLSGAEKESITRAGVGSILFNSLKINETLKNEFGLQVNLGTEISEQEGSYLTHRSGEGNSLGKVRSATTIAIKKKINDAMSMSMTSTVGTNAGQRQSMNLNYNINNTYSVEGVFEKRSNLEGDQENIGNSFGADLKMKWSFK